MNADVWIGESARCELDEGAVATMRAVVGRDVPPYTIATGSPIRIVRYRFERCVIDELLRMRWWKYGQRAVEGANFEYGEPHCHDRQKDRTGEA